MERGAASPATAMLTLPPLYAILDVEALAARQWAPADVCRAWLSAGVRLIQLRAKSLESGAFLDLAGEALALCHSAGALLIINDRADIAVMAGMPDLAGADGVHVGQQDLAPADVRRVTGPTAIVGLSTHDDAQVAEAITQPISYLAIGPVFGTRTKDTGCDAVGLEQVRRAATAARGAGMPLVAIGGITHERAPEVLAAGADTLAVISDLLPEGRSGLETRAREWLHASRARL